MLSDPTFDYVASESQKLKLQETWKHFKNNYELIQEKPKCFFSPERSYKKRGIPSPRQYVAWAKLLNLLGEKEFVKESVFEEISLYKHEIILCKEKFLEYLNPDDELEITIVCGSFWKKKYKCRNKIMELLTGNIDRKKWKIKVHTQDSSLKKEFKNNYSVDTKTNRIYYVPYRIDIHHIIINNKTHPEKSCFFFELPHTEKLYFRTFAYISFDEGEKFNCSKEDLLFFLDKQPKSFHPRHIIKQFFTKSLLSFINRVIK